MTQVLPKLLAASILRMRRGSCLGLVLLLATTAFQADARTAYRTGSDCDGFPSVDLNTPPGLCVGLVAKGLGFARGVAMIGDDIYVADMGGWVASRGRLLRLAADGRKPPQVLLEKLDKPNALSATPDGRLLLGVAGKIVVLDPLAKDIAATMQDVVVGLPRDGRHPLTAFALAPDGALFINIGSATDHCERADGSDPDATQPCPETIASPPRGAILRIAADQARPVDAARAEVFAHGLRNTMAMSVLASGELIGATNERDAIDRRDPKLNEAELPREPFGKIVRDARYGWPYCYDSKLPSPEFPSFDCSKMQAPDLWLPAHSAPMGMLIYRGDAQLILEESVIVSLHGYRDHGHKLVRIPIQARDGKLEFGTAQDLIWSWNHSEGTRPRGTPVGLAQAKDGSVLIVEDLNGTLLRLAPAPKR